MSSADLTNLLSALLVNRVPAWHQVKRQGHLSFPPVGGTPGVLIEGSPRTRVLAATALSQDRRTGYIEIAVGDVVATYSLLVAATAIVFDAAIGQATSISDILTGIFDAAIVAAPAGITFTLLADSEGRAIAVQVESDPSGTFAADGVATSFVFGAFSATGVGELAVFGEVPDFDFEVWATSARGRSDGPPAPEQWTRILGTETVTKVGRAGGEFENTAGLSRIAAVVPTSTAFVGDDAAVQPAFYIHLGPSSDEGLNLSATASGS